MRVEGGGLTLYLCYYPEFLLTWVDAVIYILFMIKKSTDL